MRGLARRVPWVLAGAVALAGWGDCGDDAHEPAGDVTVAALAEVPIAFEAEGDVVALTVRTVRTRRSGRDDAAMTLRAAIVPDGDAFTLPSLRLVAEEGAGTPLLEVAYAGASDVDQTALGAGCTVGVACEARWALTLAALGADAAPASGRLVLVLESTARSLEPGTVAIEVTP